MDKDVIEIINERKAEIDRLNEQINSGNLKRKEVKLLEKEIKKLEKMNKKSEFWGGLAKKTEDTGNKLQHVGGEMQKAGLKTTAAVWTPVIYLGYKAVKKSKDKNSTPEADLIALIKECEQAHKEGKIDEEAMKDYITDFVNNYYRK